MFSPADTIVALATAPAPAGIGVVRISGPRAHAIARTMLAVDHDLQPRHATLTRALEHGTEPGAGSRRCAIDEVVATFFPAPHSYTCEDVVEISAHGSLELLREILAAAMRAGARLAEPGEFTLRAFLNGRLDLVQAEAVADLVDAVTPLQARVAFDQLDGTLTRAIAALDAELFDMLVRLEASVDFPDEGYHFVGPDEVVACLERVRSGVDTLAATAARGRMIREGRQIAILGKPNVGKSSLFNLLVGTDRAIVAAAPGTTRDLLRETIDFEGLRLGLVDTAGIRPTEDEVEREGVTRARRAGGVADLVLLVLDGSRPLEDADQALVRETAGSPSVIVINKSDLPAAWDPREIRALTASPDLEAETSGREGPEAVASAGADARIVACGRRRAVPAASPGGQRGTAYVVVVSLKTGAGLESLRRAMRDILGSGEMAVMRDTPVVTNLRHAQLLGRARAALDQALENLRAPGCVVSEELVIADLASVRRAFEEITGRRTSEDVLRAIFERFCIGK